MYLLYACMYAYLIHNLDENVLKESKIYRKFNYAYKSVFTTNFLDCGKVIRVARDGIYILQFRLYSIMSLAISFIESYLNI